MSTTAVEQALENIYTSVNGNNENIEQYIVELKKALDGKKDVTVDTSRLVYRNRQSRKIMQSFFKKRGVLVSFSEDKTDS